MWTRSYYPRATASRSISDLRRTFSAAEGFAYNLRALGRSSSSARRTRGGAIPSRAPCCRNASGPWCRFAQARNPLTGGNWQGTGVAPDIESPADQALAVAQRDAARMLIERHRDDPINPRASGAADTLIYW